MELIEVIKYLSKFPSREGVLKNFKRNTSTMEGYSDLMGYIAALPPAIMPEIKDFVVGTSEKDISERIRNLDNYFMFLEYGQIMGDYPDRMRIRKVSFNLAVYICYHDNSRNIDSMEEAIIMDNCLQYAIRLAKHMIADDNELIPHLRFAESVLNFSPVEPALMYQSIGWGLTFKKSNNLEL
ncbi:MAG TPA: hypothetical protein VFG54_12170 [Prolixibacteraceae bacterium]|nr:hypothetical protein [Prolixibacteraceae bacterium]